MMTPQGVFHMANDADSPLRSWREIAEEASQEQNTEKLLKLTEELGRALDKRDQALRKGKKAVNSVHDAPANVRTSSSRAKGV